MGNDSNNEAEQGFGKKEVQQENSDPSSLAPWIIAAVLIAIAVVGFLTSRTAVSIPQVKNGLQKMVSEVDDYLEHYEISLEYKDITLSGGFFNRMVHLHEPVLTLSSAGSDGQQQHWVLSSDKLGLAPENSALTQFVTHVEKPFTLKDAVGSYRVIPKDNIEISVAYVDNAKRRELIYSGEFDKDLHMIVEAFDAEDKPAWSFSRKMGVGSSIHGVLDMMAGTFLRKEVNLNAVLEYEDIRLNVANAEAVYEQAVDEGNRLIHYVVTVKDAVMEGKYSALGAISGTVEIEQKKVPDGATQYYTIPELMVEGDDFAIDATGDIEAPSGQSLPYGQASMVLSNAAGMLQRLQDAGVIDEQIRKILSYALNKTSSKTEIADRVTLEIERKQGGAFLIGNTTFEELAIAVVGEMLGKTQPAAAPAVTEEENSEGENTDTAQPDTKGDQANSKADGNTEPQEEPDSKGTKEQIILEPQPHLEGPSETLPTDIKHKVESDANAVSEETVKEVEDSLQEAGEALQDATEELKNATEELEATTKEIADDTADAAARAVESADDTINDAAKEITDTVAPEGP